MPRFWNSSAINCISYVVGLLFVFEIIVLCMSVEVLKFAFLAVIFTTQFCQLLRQLTL